MKIKVVGWRRSRAKKGSKVPLDYEKLFSECRERDDHCLYNAMQIDCPCDCCVVLRPRARKRSADVAPFCSWKGCTIPSFCITAGVSDSTEEIVSVVINAIRDQIHAAVEYAQESMGSQFARALVIFEPLTIRKRGKKKEGRIVLGVAMKGKI